MSQKNPFIARLWVCAGLVLGACVVEPPAGDFAPVADDPGVSVLASSVACSSVQCGPDVSHDFTCTDNGVTKWCRNFEIGGVWTGWDWFTEAQGYGFCDASNDACNYALIGPCEMGVLCIPLACTSQDGGSTWAWDFNTGCCAAFQVCGQPGSCCEELGVYD